MSKFNEVLLNKNKKNTEIENGLIRASFEITNHGIEQKFYARKSNSWILVAESFKPQKPFPEYGNHVYNSDIDKEHRLIVTELLNSIQIVNEDDMLCTVILSGGSGNTIIAQSVSLAAGSEHFHIEVDAELSNTIPKLEYLLSPFTFNIEGKPDYTHAPGFKRNPRHKAEVDPSNLIGDRVFFSPTALVQKDRIFAAIVPDVDIINQ